MNSTVWWLTLLALTGVLPVLAEEDPRPEPIGATVYRGSNWTVYEAILPGEIVDWGSVPGTDGPETLALLLEMEDESRQVLRWSLAGDGALEEIGDRLPEEAETVMTWAGGSWQESVLIAKGNIVLGLAEEDRWTELYASPYDVYPLADSTGAIPPGGTELVVRSVGLLQGLARDPVSRAIRATWEFDLPLSVDREWGGLRLRSPPIVHRAWASELSPGWILGPEAHGRRRVRTVLLAPVAGGTGLEATEMWNLLPSAEEMDESWYVQFNGAPALIVTSVLAEKHGVFEKKKLRLFELSADRTRSGSLPQLETMTRTRNWYGTCAGIADLNGDGLDDLVSAQPKGLGGGSLWVEGYLARAEGGFEPKPRGSEIEVEEAEICNLTVDVDGDSHVDLVAVENDSVLVFSLIRAPESQAVVDANPGWRVDFDDIEGRPRPVKILGSPGGQIFVTGHTEGKRQAARIVLFR